MVVELFTSPLTITGSVTAASSSLINWCYSQRVTYAKGKLKTERMTLFKDIGFNFEIGEPYFSTLAQAPHVVILKQNVLKYKNCCCFSATRL